MVENMTSIIFTMKNEIKVKVVDLGDNQVSCRVISGVDTAKKFNSWSMLEGKMMPVVKDVRYDSRTFASNLHSWSYLSPLIDVSFES